MLAALPWAGMAFAHTAAFLSSFTAMSRPIGAMFSSGARIGRTLWLPAGTHALVGYPEPWARYAQIARLVGAAV